MRRAALLSSCLLALACGGDPASTTSGAGGAGAGAGGSGGDGAVGGSGGEAPLSLRFVADFNIPTGAQLDGVELGGLSGITIDPTTGHAWAICDDQEQFGPPRFYELDVALDAQSLSVTPQSFTTFATGATPSAEMDAEGIARDDAGTLYVSAEGDTTPVVPPTILHLAGDGSLLEELPIDPKFVPDAPQTKGVRRNMGFEALTLSPSGDFLFTASERTLAQDGPVATFDEGNRCRILRIERATGATLEVVYQTEPIPAPLPGVLGAADIGVPELLALSDERLLVLERAAVQVDGVFSNTIRLFEVDLTGAPDVSGLDPLPGEAPALAKRLVLDLDSILPALDPNYPRLDNFEGMSFGPRLPDGGETLLLVSDNNFGVTQRTAFFAFAIE
ncbi:MAG: esterase-like activity of phytase family protein [Polyangiaceae bacterium]